MIRKCAKGYGTYWIMTMRGGFVSFFFCVLEIPGLDAGKYGDGGSSSIPYSHLVLFLVLFTARSRDTGSFYFV